MKLRAGIVLLVALTACTPADAGTDGQTDTATDSQAYGEPLTLTETTPVSDILSDPEAWVGERVLVEGMVVDVCEKRGCWMEIAAGGDFEKIRVKVDDGVIVFPLTARGKTALVEGTVEKVELTYEEAVEQARHQAEEHGEEFDPASVTGPETTYRIRGIGAVIRD